MIGTGIIIAAMSIFAKWTFMGAIGALLMGQIWRSVS